MNIFSKLFGSKNPKQAASFRDMYMEFGIMISLNDQKVLTQIQFLFDDTEAFIKKHQEQYYNRGIDPQQWKKEDLYWISFADILIENNYAVEFDVSSELDDFEYLLKDLKGFESFPLPNFPILNQDEAVYLWIEQINQHWQNEQILLMQQDIDGDCHVVFPVKKQYIAFLETTSKKLGKTFFV
ncbi:MAG: hypothetical protein Q4B43_03130 [Bacteroidota bacterium]|nr:hypothetical protein [Bacteroidota bacterium]